MRFVLVFLPAGQVSTGPLASLTVLREKDALGAQVRDLAIGTAEMFAQELITVLAKHEA